MYDQILLILSYLRERVVFYWNCNYVLVHIWVIVVLGQWLPSAVELIISLYPHLCYSVH
jgi:hypothetical protein